MKNLLIVVSEPDGQNWQLQLISKLLELLPDFQLVGIVKSSAKSDKSWTWNISNLIDRTFGKLVAKALNLKFTTLNSHPIMRFDEIGRNQSIDIIINLTTDEIPTFISQKPNIKKLELAIENRAIGPTGIPAFEECVNDRALYTVSIVESNLLLPEKKIVASGTYKCFRWCWNLNALILASRCAILFRKYFKEESYIKEKKSQKKEGKYLETDLIQYKNFYFLVGVCKLSIRFIKEFIHKSMYEDMYDIVVRPEIDSKKNGVRTSILSPPPNKFWADPFVIEKNRNCYIFFEEYEYTKRKGRISYLKLPENLTEFNQSHLIPEILFDEDTHMSYPFLFEFDKRLFMIPETSAARKVEIRECIEFPNVWEPRRILFDNLKAIDTSLVCWQNQWWLFTNIESSEIGGFGDSGNELHVFFSDDPIEGQWLPHKKNPVIIDAASARMAGGLIIQDGDSLIRCAQVQGKHYGEDIVYKKIIQLDENIYQEKTWDNNKIIPLVENCRTHHFNCRNGWMTADRVYSQNKLKRYLSSIFYDSVALIRSRHEQ